MKKFIALVVLGGIAFLLWEGTLLNKLLGRLDPCRLVTKQEIEEAYRVTAEKPNHIAQLYLIGTGDACEYKTSGVPEKIIVSVVNSCDAKPGFQDATHFGQPEPVEGLGKDAASFGPILFVRHGDKCLVFTAEAGESDRAIAVARRANQALARKALERLSN